MKFKGKKKGRGEGGIKETSARAKALMALQSFFSLKLFLCHLIDLFIFHGLLYGHFQNSSLPWSHGVSFSQRPRERRNSYPLLVSDSKVRLVQLKSGIQVA